MEGQQRFDNHVDKLMNYIRYWQASGESIKTSIRTKTRLGQIVQEGRFRGGPAPFGYQLVKQGRVGKKNKELYDLKINNEEAMIVRKIFEKAANYGYGARRVASDLKDEGHLNRSGEMFHYSTIQNIFWKARLDKVLRYAIPSLVCIRFQIIQIMKWFSTLRLYGNITLITIVY